jgi:hypothetical protein
MLILPSNSGAVRLVRAVLYGMIAGALTYSPILQHAISDCARLVKILGAIAASLRSRWVWVHSWQVILTERTSMTSS